MDDPSKTALGRDLAQAASRIAKDFIGPTDDPDGVERGAAEAMRAELVALAIDKGLDPNEAVGLLSGTLEPDGFVRISGNISGRLASEVSGLPLTINWTSQKE